MQRRAPRALCQPTGAQAPLISSHHWDERAAGTGHSSPSMLTNSWVPIGLADSPGWPAVSEVCRPQVGSPAAREGLRGELPHLRHRQQDRPLPQRLGEASRPGLGSASQGCVVCSRPQQPVGQTCCHALGLAANAQKSQPLGWVGAGPRPRPAASGVHADDCPCRPQDKLDGFVPAHFIGWYLKVGDLLLHPIPWLSGLRCAPAASGHRWTPGLLGGQVLAAEHFRGACETPRSPDLAA